MNLFEASGIPLPPELEVPNEKEEKEPCLPSSVSPNPCIALYGPGEQGGTCQHCIHLRYSVQRNPSVRYWKCDLRPLTNGAGTDHRVRWPSCAKYQERTEPYHGG